jgi:hypothetical protein
MVPPAPAGTIKRFNLSTSCPSGGENVNVLGATGTAGSGAICAIARYSDTPAVVYAQVYPDAIFPHSPNIPFPGCGPASSALPTSPGVFYFDSVSLAVFSNDPTKNLNDIAFWYQETTGGPIVYDTSVQFHGVASNGISCCSGSGSGMDFQPAQMFPATWKVEIKGLEGPLAFLNNVYIVRSTSGSSPNYENGGNGQTHPRVTMSYCGQSGSWTLLVLGRGHSFSAEAASTSPFGPLRFRMHGTLGALPGPVIVATPVGK